MARINEILDEMEKSRERRYADTEGKRSEYRREWEIYTSEE